MTKRLLAAAAAVLLSASMTGAASFESSAQPSAAPAAAKYKTCQQLNARYRHGVGMPGARDRVRGKTKPVTNFARNAALYRANTHLDRDKDRIACEKR